ncbi:het and ankyrin domain protein [Colletotrichum camelliae]|nr:het and ankyrin domain protein [Colletotrichum camelliae]
MKLLHIDTGTLHKSSYPPQVPYAILSHTWSSPAENEWIQYNPGNAVIGTGTSAVCGIITKFCHLARAQGYEHVWIDAVCVDKTSSADVSETINSLPRYFQRAGVCFVYLADLPCGPSLPWKDTWAQCRFWNRAWTLQELLLPTKVQFYDVEWHLRGERAAGCLPALISGTTGIDEDILTQQRSLCQTSVACKMSWAARREGTRSEDIAYSLLGIFGVRMPIVYGEGEHRAFRRLQEEVLKTTNDMSLFAWTGAESEERRGIFADGPWEFVDFGKSTLARLPCTYDGFSALTSKGVLIEGQFAEQSDALFLDLGVQKGDEDNFRQYGILLQKRIDGTFERINSKLAEKLPTRSEATTMRIIAWRGDLDVTELSHVSVKDAPVDVKQSPDSVPAPRRPLRISSEEPTTPERISSHPRDSLETETTPTGSNFNISCLSSSEDKEWVQIPPTSDEDADSDDCGQMDGYDSLQTSQYTDVDQEWDSAQSVISEATTLGSPQLGGDDSWHTCARFPTHAEYPSQRHNSFLPKSDDSNISGNDELRAHLSRVLIARFSTSQEVDTHVAEKRIRRERRSRERSRQSSNSRRRRTLGLPEFACLFFAKDPVRHASCVMNHELRSMEDVREHLWLRHRLPSYCPICKNGFQSASDRDEHIIQQNCDPSDFFPFEGVSEDQRRLLSSTERTMSDAYQWYRAWDILFEGLNLERPCSPFLRTGLGLNISNFRTFWHRHGRSILEEALADRHDGIPPQEIGMEKLSTEVLSDTLRTLDHISERQSPAYV